MLLKQLLIASETNSFHFEIPVEPFDTNIFIFPVLSLCYLSMLLPERQKLREEWGKKNRGPSLPPLTLAALH